jgi:dihydrofolate reductase
VGILSRRAGLRRTLFEVTEGWQGRHTLDVPVVVAVTGGTIARQCLDLGLLDEVAVDLVPVVMGEGNRPFFGKLSADDVLLGNPSVCVEGDRVTHLVFPVVR